VPHGFAIILHHGPQFAHEDGEERDEDHLGHEDQGEAEPPELSEDELNQAIEMCEAELKMLHALRNGDRVAAGKWAQRWHELGGSLEEDEGNERGDAGGR
jgi:hypothetical protein